jgi:signal transduction histidine kinase
LLDDELMSDTRLMRRPFSWSSIAAIVVEVAAAGGFVIAVYELVVAGGIHLLGDDWKLVLFIAAAAISGSGMTAVRSAARSLVHRLLPAADPYPTLMSSVSGAAAAGPAEDAMPRLAQMLADGTGARSAAVWLTGPSGLWQASSWPQDEGSSQPVTVASTAELPGLAGVDYVAPVRYAGKVLGALTLRARTGRYLALPDVRLAADVANAAGLLLYNAELAEQLRDQVRVETAQAAELAASRRRVVVARDTAREQLSAEIGARVCEPLEHCGGKVGRILLAADAPGTAPLEAGLAEMTALIGRAIADFRRIVHGVYPPVLGDHGLRAAMESLLAGIDLPAALVSHRIPRLAPRVEAGTYFCAAALLREWHAAAAQAPMRVLIGVTSTKILMTFVDAVPETAGRPAIPVSPLVLEAVQDRVAALGGRMLPDHDSAGRRLMIEVPLTPADLVTQGSGGRR